MNKATPKISALLITFNEEDNINEVLANLSFADEIIVVDSYSTDNTLKLIRENKNVKLICRKFVNYTDQKKYALEQANYDWILFLDADERITPSLKDEILKVITEPDAASAYFFQRTFMFKTKKIYFSGWQSDKNYRLFRKSKVHFDQDRIVHETLVVDGASATMKHKLLHFSYKNYEDYKGKMLKYGRMKAKEEAKKGKKARWYHFIFRPLYKFINHYIIRLGILDGKKGLIICYLNALGVYARYKELKQLQS
ncbi:glycosyltransferase family 2 protein [Maribacter ulvicola]|uniref:Glycosyltransferase involved in cell wall bisynthesis n=1 Tax=Maribacter ulvicola TaxID=228959 RepID=A0A1N6SDI9_9FLAO|nr:glycosyltransferase family 2 protein [Maribacter ulvicola]SIQ39109.1 Glycosyltransferase involved in cell wall bisynthesis [Maribacter ulvicola]